MEQKNENPLYGAADVGDAVFNPIYDRFVSLNINSNCWFNN